MNPHIQLYQFTREGDSISIASIIDARTDPGPQAGQETVTLHLQVEEILWGSRGPSARDYAFARPASQASQLKFPDPVWGRVEIHSRERVLLVTPPASARAALDPVYVEHIPEGNDPVLKTIRDLLEVERIWRDADERFERRVNWLTSGTVVQKLFAGEALTQGSAPSLERARQLDLDFASAFAREDDEYIKISLGTWLWKALYPDADEPGKIAILNATIVAVSSQSRNVRDFALDRLFESNPELLRKPGIKPSQIVVNLLNTRKAEEPDAGVRQHLDELIDALRR